MLLRMVCVGGCVFRCSFIHENWSNLANQRIGVRTKEFTQIAVSVSAHGLVGENQGVMAQWA